MGYKEKITIIAEVLWLSVLIGAVVLYAWTHSVFLIFWLVMLVLNLLVFFKRYSNIEFVTVNKIYNVDKDRKD
jgi:hypothetical protein